MPFNTFLNTHGVWYNVVRSDVEVSKCRGLPNTEQSTKRKYIGFSLGTDILPNDILVNPSAEKVYVVDTQTQFFKGQPHQLKVFYQTEQEHNNIQNHSGDTIFNINNATNSIIGNYNSSTINAEQTIADMKSQVDENLQDKEELNQIISLLEMIIDEKLPAKKGLFSRFSDTLAKHSWFTGQLAGALLKWLTSQN